MMRRRALVVIAVLAVLAMLVMRWCMPITRGSIGFSPLGGSPRLQIASVAPSSPAAAAGMRRGDIVLFDRMPLAQRVNFLFATVGTPMRLTVQRGARTIAVRVAPVAVSSGEFFGLPGRIRFALVLLYLAIAVLVAWRAEATREASLILAFLLGLAATGGFINVQDVALSSAWQLAASVAAGICVGVLLIAQFAFALVFPARQSRVRTWLVRVGMPFAFGTAVVQVVSQPAFAVLVPVPTDWIPAWCAIVIVFSLASIAAVIDGIRNGAPEYRVAAVTAGSTLILLAAINLAANVCDLVGADTRWFDTADILQWTAGVGMAYAILRHRLLDLHVVISRAAIFSVVSLCLIVLFLIVEGALSLILEHAIGPRFGARSQSALAVLVALCVGLCARGIHERVRHRLNRIFYAARYRALAELHRFALETDAATAAEPLVRVALAVLRRSLSAQYVEMYAGEPESGYGLLDRPESAAPVQFSPNDEIVLRLRRWSESFVVDILGHSFEGALICPMTLRGRLYGFVVCGPKRDGGGYLPDETQALTMLAHRVGIAYEWLTRERPLRGLQGAGAPAGVGAGALNPKR